MKGKLPVWGDRLGGTRGASDDRADGLGRTDPRQTQAGDRWRGLGDGDREGGRGSGANSISAWSMRIYYSTKCTTCGPACHSCTKFGMHRPKIRGSDGCGHARTLRLDKRQRSRRGLCDGRELSGHILAFDPSQKADSPKFVVLWVGSLSTTTRAATTVHAIKLVELKTTSLDGAGLIADETEQNARVLIAPDLANYNDEVAFHSCGAGPSHRKAQSAAAAGEKHEEGRYAESVDPFNRPSPLPELASGAHTAQWRIVCGKLQVRTLPSASIMMSPILPILAQTFEFCTRGGNRCLMVCVVCCRVQPCPAGTLRVQLDRGAAACDACLKCGRRGRPAFADPLCARRAHGGVQPVGNRDKVQILDPDQGTQNGEI